MNPSAGDWLSCFAFPLAGLGISAASLYYVIRRGWRRKMPALSFYVALCFVTSLLLLAVLYPRYFVHGALRDKLCSLYADGYQLLDAAEAILLVAVVYELFALITRGRNAMRRIVQIALCTLFLGIAVWGYTLISDRGGSAEAVLSRVTAVAARASALTVIAAMFLFWLLKNILKVRLNRSLGHFALLLGFYYPVQIFLDFAARRHPSQTVVFLNLTNIWWFVFVGVLLTMLIKGTPSVDPRSATLIPSS